MVNKSRTWDLKTHGIHQWISKGNLSISSWGDEGFVVSGTWLIKLMSS